MAEFDRGQHPDLIDDAPAPEPEAPAPPRAARGRRTPEPPPAAEPTPDQDAPPAEPEAPTEPPEWHAQVREAFDKDPSEAFKLLSKNLPRDILEKDDVISGLIGSRVEMRADQRARELVRQQERDAAERVKLEAAQNNDLYALGEITQRELQERQASQQASQQAGGFLDGVVLFQQQLPEDVQKQIQGRVFGEGKGQAAGVAEYLEAVSEARIKLREAELEREFHHRESALRKSVLSEVNGDVPVPERDGGTPGRVREVTDEQIEAMTMREYDALFDENGVPKPGVRHRATRGIPLTQR